MTTGGEGGMVTTGDRAVWEAVWSFKDHGRSHGAVYDRNHPAGFRWFIESFGTNWRMTEMQAAIGRAQLPKLSEWLAKRRRNASVLAERFSRLPALRVAVPPSHVDHAYYKYYVFMRPERLRAGWTRDRILGELLERGYPVSVGVCPEIYREKAFVEAGYGPPERLTIARELGGDLAHVQGASHARARAHAPYRGPGGRGAGGSDCLRGPTRGAVEAGRSAVRAATNATKVGRAWAGPAC